MLGGRLSLPKAVLKRKRVMQSCLRAKKGFIKQRKKKTRDLRLHKSSRTALPLRTARPIWQDSRKTSRRAQRLRGSLPSGCHGRPRPCAPGDHDETGLCRISCSGAGIRPKPNGRVRHPASFDNPPHDALCDGSNRTLVPGHQAKS